MKRLIANTNGPDGHFKSAVIHSMSVNFWFPTGKRKKDIRLAKQGEISEEAKLFLHFARHCGFKADLVIININGAMITVRG